MDYNSVMVDITFDPSPIDTTSYEDIQLFSDDVIEEGELFTVEISSPDMNVDILQQSSTVAIQDLSTINIDFDSSVYAVREVDDVIEICAQLSGGTLQRSIEVEFATQDSTATGTFLRYC